MTKVNCLKLMCRVDVSIRMNRRQLKVQLGSSLFQKSILHGQIEFLTSKSMKQVMHYLCITHMLHSQYELRQSGSLGFTWRTPLYHVHKAIEQLELIQHWVSCCMLLFTVLCVSCPCFVATDSPLQDDSLLPGD